MIYSQTITNLKNFHFRIWLQKKIRPHKVRKRHFTNRNWGILVPILTKNFERNSQQCECNCRETFFFGSKADHEDQLERLFGKSLVVKLSSNDFHSSLVSFYSSSQMTCFILSLNSLFLTHSNIYYNSTTTTHSALKIGVDMEMQVQI